MSVGRHTVATASVCDVSERSHGSGEESECVCCDTLYRCCSAGNGDAEECCAVLMFGVRRDVGGRGLRGSECLYAALRVWVCGTSMVQCVGCTVYITYCGVW